MLFSSNPACGLSRVVSAAERLAQGDRDSRAPTDKMTTLVRRAAVAVNSLAGQIGAQQATSPSFAEQLGIKPRSPSQPASPPPPPANKEPALPPPPPAQDLSASATLRPEEGLGDVDSFLSGTGQTSQPVPSPATVPAPRAAGPVSSPGASSAFSSPFSAPSSSSTNTSFAKAKPAPAASPMTTPMYQAPSPDEFGHDQTVIAQTPEALIRATQRSTSFPSPPSTPPLASGAAVPLPPPATGSEEAHFQQVFKEFVATREKCREPADGLTFDKFAQKLRKNQEQLIQKYQCRTVRFQVYVKDGKAALKATPVR
jgi:hypothetical protein